MSSQNRIVVGMSGGVDSAVAALTLKEQGYDVIAVFMKNWDETDEDGQCTAAADYEDAVKVCAAIDVPLYAVNFEKEYYELVFEHFLAEYRAFRTPNPDVLCNSRIKFRCFLDFAMTTGASAMATGHYARVVHEEGRSRLFKGADPNKDQSYFLCMLDQSQLSRALFPIGHMVKGEVRAMAERHSLPVANKKDSTGICFIGERNFRAFLKNYLPACPGDIVDMEGSVVGRHQGLMYYTLGQRRGLGIGGVAGQTGQGRWFVVSKDVAANRLVVSQGDETPLYSVGCTLSGLNFFWPPEKEVFDCQAKLRYRQADQSVTLHLKDGGARIDFHQPQRAVTPGQYAVLYDGNECLGGGVIETVDFP